MVAFVKHQVSPLVVMKLVDSKVKGREGDIWESVIGLRVLRKIHPAIQVNERGDGGALRLEPYDVSAEGRGRFDQAMAVLKHYAERDLERAAEDADVREWMSHLVCEICEADDAGTEFTFNSARFLKHAIPMNERKCWCGKALDRSKNSYASTCSEFCDEEQQFDLHFQHMQTLLPDVPMSDYDHLPRDNHVPGVSKLIRQISRVQRKGAWPQDENKGTVELARVALVNAAAYLEEAKAHLRTLRAIRDLIDEPQGICVECAKHWRLDKYQTFKAWWPCGGCRAECARALRLKEVPKP